MAEYTFYPKFQEFVTLYRGVVRVWIGNGVDTGTAGVLYAEYIDGFVQQLGVVSDYEEARKYFADLGISLSYEEWVELLIGTPKNVERSEAWAVGTVNGTAVDQSDETHNNNSKYYADQSKIWSNGNNLAGNSVQPTNNSKYWAEQSKEFTNGTDLNGNSVQARAADNASYYSNQSKLWANNGTDGDSPTAQNNAKHWAEQAKEFADGCDFNDDPVQARATDNSEYYKDQSKLWANFGTDGNSPSASNNSKAYSEDSHESALESESWAKGTRDGLADEVRQNAATDNSKYYSEQSDEARRLSVVAQEASEQAQQASEEAKGLSEEARESAILAQNNAADYASNAYTSETNALSSEQQSEAWAVGKRDGSDVDPSDETYQNNAKYYAIQMDQKIAEFGNMIQNGNTVYQNSDYGDTPPSSGSWTSSPNPVEGKYLWSKTTFQWGGGQTTILYTVSYIGINGTGAVNSINGMTGTIVIDGRNVSVDASAQQPESISSKFASIASDISDLQVSITNQEIDEIFAEEESI